MNELLKKLLETELLTEEMADQLTEALTAELDQLKESVREEERTQIQQQLVEQWETERNQLIEALDTQLSEVLTAEINELKEDIDQFRDLEVEYNQRLVEAKEQMKVKVNEDLDKLASMTSDFLEMRLGAEMEELKEDIQEVKRLEFGRHVFEGFMNDFKKHFAVEDGSEATISDLQKQVSSLSEALATKDAQIEQTTRAAKIAELTESLDGDKKAVMESILERVPTDRLEKTFESTIGRLLKESAEPSKAKETEVLAESESVEDAVKTSDESLKEGKIVTGDKDEIVQLDETVKQGLSDEARAWIQAAAGTKS